MIELHNVDCMTYMAGLEDNAIDAIITDPPYYKVKGEAWDNQWDSAEGFLEWVAELLVEFERILKPNGSLYFFASPKMSARVEIEISKRFNVLNNIAWRKGKAGYKEQGWSQKTRKEDLRGFIPQTEKIIFAEHYNSDNQAKGEAGYLTKCDELRGFVFEPLRAYIRNEFKRAGMLNQQGRKDADKACGVKTMASKHYFDRSQWQLPTAEHYQALRDLLNTKGGEYLKREYEYLKREYEDLRRPFNVTAKDQWGDIWEFDPVAAYPGKHVCEKPLPLLAHMLNSSTKPDALVFDPFAGSGSMGEACKLTGRNFIGTENCLVNYRKASERLDALDRQVAMF